MPQEIKTCEAMDDDLQAIADWASIFTDQAKLIAKVSKNYALHRKATKADIAALKADWAADEFFEAGEDVAALVNLLVGPIQ